MVTAKHLESVDAFLRDLKDAVAIVKADPSLAQKGGAATYGLIANIPLRGMVRQRVLDIFAGMYRAGGAEFDLSASPDPVHGGPQQSCRWPSASRSGTWRANGAGRAERECGCSGPLPSTTIEAPRTDDVRTTAAGRARWRPARGR